MTYVPTDGTSLTELIRLVRISCGDFPQHVYHADLTGDAVQTIFQLYRMPYATSGVTATVSGTATTSFTVDYDSATVTFNSAPAQDAPIILQYYTVLATDEQITAAINDAIDECSREYQVQDQNATMETDGTTELLCETADGDDLLPEDVITKVEYWYDPNWVTLHEYRVDNSSGKKYLHFPIPPPSGYTIRISYSVRPPWLISGSQTLEGTCGLPGDAKGAIVPLAASRLVSDHLTARTHSNQFYNVEPKNAASTYDLRMRIQDLRAEGELALRRLRRRATNRSL